MSTAEPERGETQISATCEEAGATPCQSGKSERQVCRGMGSSFVEPIAGAATVILAILGLAGIQNPYMLAILTIIVGVALLDEGCSLMVRCARMVLCTADEACHPPQLMGGLSGELLAGAVGVVLGLLALLGVAAPILVPAAIIVFGASLTCSSCLRAKLCHVECVITGKSEAFRQVAHEAALAAAGAQVLIGIGVVILGILGVLGHNMIIVSLVALLVLGFSILLNGAATNGRIWIALGHH